MVWTLKLGEKPGESLRELLKLLDSSTEIVTVCLWLCLSAPKTFNVHVTTKNLIVVTVNHHFMCITFSSLAMYGG